MAANYFTPQPEMLIEDVDTLKVLADPQRMQIMRAFDQPRTVKEVAMRLNRPATKLYYHVNLLEKHDIIRVVETNIVSGIIEKQYQIMAEQYKVAGSLLASSEMDEHLEAVLTTVFDVAKVDIKSSIQLGLMDLEHKEEEPLHNSILSHSQLYLTEAQFTALRDQLNSILEEYGHLDQHEGVPGTKAYGLVAALYPLPYYQEGSDE